jgi:hypothetical protein
VPLYNRTFYRLNSEALSSHASHFHNLVRHIQEAQHCVFILGDRHRRSGSLDTVLNFR